jgi:hypothetical protein
MEDYYRKLADDIRENQLDFIETYPQPQMFGGKRLREHPLPGLTNFQYPSTLAVGGPVSHTIGGGFWSDLGHGVSSVGKSVAPVALDIGKQLAIDAAKSYIKGSGRGEGRMDMGHSATEAHASYPFPPYTYPLNHLNQMSPMTEFQSTELGSGRRRGRPRKGGFGFKDIGNAFSSVGRVVAPVAGDIGKSLIPVATDIGKDMAKEALKSYMTKGSARSGGKGEIKMALDMAKKGISGAADQILNHPEAAMQMAGLLGHSLYNKLTAGKRLTKKDLAHIQMCHHYHGAGFLDSLVGVAKNLAPLAPLLLAAGHPSVHGGFGFKDIGNAFKSVGKVAAPIAGDIGKSLIPVVTDIGKDMAKDALKSYMTKGSARSGGFGWKDIGNIAKQAAPIAIPLMMAMGRHKKGGSGPKLNVEARRKKKALEREFANVEEYEGSDDDYDMVNHADYELEPEYQQATRTGMYRHVPPPKPRTWMEFLAGKPKGKGRRKKGGALLDHSQSQYAEQAHMPYPKALMSYEKKGAGKKKAPTARGQLVSKLMKEHGMTLGQASKHIKEHHLL